MKTTTLLKISFGSTEGLAQQMMQTGPEQLNALMATVAENPGLLQDPEIKAIYDQFQQSQQQPAAPTAEPAQQEPGQQEPAQQQAQPAKPAQVTEKDFLGMFFDPSNEQSFDEVKPEEFPAVVGKILSIDTTKEGWYKEALKAMADAKALKEKSTLTEKELQKVKDEINQLPTPLLTAMQAALKAEDWRKVVSAMDIDYTKEWSKLPEDEKTRIAKRFMPTINFDVEGDAKTAAIQLAEEKYKLHQQNIADEHNRQVAKQNAKAEEQKRYVARSLEKLKADYDEFNDPTRLKELEETLSQRDILSLFYDENGYLKEDGAEKYVLAKHGKRLVERVKNVTSRKIANERVAEIIERPQSVGAGANPQPVTQPEEPLLKDAQQILTSYTPTY